MAEQSIHRRRLADLVDTTTERVVEQATSDGVAVADLPTMKLRWYRIGQVRTRSRGADPAEEGSDDQATTTTEANVYVYDSIGGSLGVSAKQFAKDLDALDVDTIHLRVNSPGGAVFDAKAIMNDLRAHPARVVGHVDGIAASAATVVLLGSDEIVVEPGGEIMVHRASTTADGDDLTIQPVVDWIRRQTEDIADLYSQRSGRPAAEWDALMTAETWFYGAEAVEYGLADRAEKLTRPDPAGFEDGDIAERMARRHFRKGWKFAGRAACGAPRDVRAAAQTPAERSDRSGRAAVIGGERRAAAALRRRALDKGMMRRSSPAGITTQARRSAPSGDIAHETVELRGRTMFRTHGAFTVYGRGYEMWDLYGPYKERVRPGAGRGTIGRPDLDCVFLENHGGLTMARTSGPWNKHRGTLNLEERDTTGWHEAFLNVDRDDVRRLISAIDDRLITEMSFAFLITEGAWNDDMTEFEIITYDMDRGDVSAVNYGANPFTDITARASEILAELESMPAGAIGEAVRILSQRVDSYERLLREADPGALAHIAEPALAAAGGRASDSDRARADEWLKNAIGDASVPPEERRRDDPDDDDQATPGQEDQGNVDNNRAGGPTVASYEAMMQAHGIAVRP